jgi:hypothetical protein
MGGATFTYCGPDAVEFCRTSAADEPSVAAQCRHIPALVERREKTATALGDD